MSLFLDLIFPAFCLSCHRPGHHLCPQCASRLAPKPLSPPDPKSILEGHLSLFEYKNEIRQLIQLIKYQYVTQACLDVSRIMSETIRNYYPNLLKHWQSRDYVLMAIPLHPLRLNWRGFNQSALILEKLAPLLDLPYQTNLIIRSRYTAPQAKQSQKSDRQLHLSGAFSLNQKFNQSIPKNIILFDDVYTTGSTLQSAAATLKQSGNVSVFGLTLAG